MSDIKTNITINVVEPGSSTPVEPNTSIIESISTPDTGLFTRGIGTKEATTIGIALFTLLAIVAVIIHYHNKKHGKVTKLTKLLAQYKTILKTKKTTTICLSVLALLVSIGTLAGLLRLGVNAEEADSTENTDTTSSLTVTTESKDLTIELGDEPVFAILPVKVKVAESTQAGYTLKAYAEGTALTSTTNPDNKIPMIIPEEDKTELTNNTWGLSLTEPTSQEDNTYISLPETKEEAIILTDKDYEETLANDETIIYYGFYLAPGLPYGTYTGLKINYDAEENRTDLAMVIFDGNGLYFKGDENKTTNKTRYEVVITDYVDKYSHTSNLNDMGEVIDLNYPNNMYYVDSNETFVYKFPGANKVRVNITKTNNDGCPNDQNDFFTFWAGNYPNYTAKSYEITNPVLAFGNTTGKYVFGDYNNVQTDVDGDTVTFAYATGPQGNSRGCGSGYGYHATLTGYDLDGNVIYLPGNSLISGEYLEPAQNLPYKFLGWSEDKNTAVATYSSTKDIELELPLNEIKTTTLYAVWQHATNITFNGNGNDGGTNISDKLVAANEETSLCNYDDYDHVSAYTKTGYSFAGWNTKADGTGISYSDCEPFVAPIDQSLELVLYAQWAPATTIIYDGNGGEGNLQQQTIRASNTDSIYGNWGYFSKDGYYFASWNTKPDGSGRTYYGEDEFTAPSYSDVFILYAQWSSDCGYNIICYKSNRASTNDDDPRMSAQSTSSYSDTTLYAPNYKYDTNNDGHSDMGFVGWSEDPNAADKLTDDDEPNGPAIYGPNQTITTGDTRKGISLYAIWLPPAEDKDGNILTFQTENLLNIQLSDTEGDTLANKSNGYVTALKDSRDNEVYAIARLADGNYWMIENLRLDSNVELTTSNTNNPLTVDGGVAIKNNDDSTSSHLSSANSEWCTTWSSWCMYKSMLNTNNIANTISQMTETNANIYSYGNYYNWYSATAGQRSRAGDICPTGWILPMGKQVDTNSSFSHLDVSMGGTGGTQSTAEASNKWRSFPNNFVYSGYWSGSSPRNRGAAGYYWSSVSYNVYSAYYLGLYSGRMDPGTYGSNGNYNGHDGYSVRCVAPERVTITFDGNGNTGGEMNSASIPVGVPTPLPQNQFTKDGYIFVGWNTTPDSSSQVYVDKAEYIASGKSNNVTLYARWTDCPSKTICYKANGANASTAMSNQPVDLGYTGVSLWASNYKYDVDGDGHNDYGFAGWSEDKDAAAKLTDNDLNNNPTVYGPNQTITTSGFSTHGKDLYAVWIAPQEDATFQTFTCPSDTDMPIGSVIALRDSRDNEVYTVAKLADGNCWMTENLRLDNSATINSTNTNNPISTFTALSPSSDSWCTSTYSSCINQSVLNINNTTNTVSQMAETNANIYSYGNYYNWYSATAGNGKQENSSNTMALGDICPTGWHLPYGGSGEGENEGNTKGGFYYLNWQISGTSTVNSNDWRSFPNNFVYSGNWQGSSGYRGSYGYYWSSTASSINGAYALRFDYRSASQVFPSPDGINKYSGYSVRCVSSVQ